jgi:hypothetical protein
MECGMSQETSEEKRASHRDGLPHFDDSKQQYTQKIGYSLNRKSKQRTRKTWNLGSDYHAACEAAITLRKTWDQIVVRQIWTDFSRQAQKMLPKYDWSKPVWPEEWMLVEGMRVKDALIDQVRQAQKQLESVSREFVEVGERVATQRIQSATELDPEIIEKYLAKKGLVAVPSNSPLGAPANVEEIAITEAKNRYLSQEKARIGRGGGKGIKVRTYNAKRKNLNLVLGLTTAKSEPHVIGRTPIDVTRMLRCIQKADLEAIVHFWMDLPRGIDSSRTAINYLREFESFLRWCEEQESFGFVRPKGTDELFRFSVQKSKKAVNYDPDVLRGLLNSGSEKCKLFQLLGANGGLYQQDIAILRDADLIIHNGQPCLWWIRSKEELVEGEESTFRILTPLWPEAHDLLLRFRAPKQNPQDWSLLNEAGKQLVSTIVDKQTSDAVSKAFNEAWGNYVKTLANPPAKKFTFKQWRKIGWNIVKRLDNKFMANLWSGQRINGNDFNYDDAQPEDYDPVFPVVEKYRQKLIEDKVLG